MTTTRFDAFNRIALYVLVELFEAFPSRTIIHADKLGLDAKPDDQSEADDEIWTSMDQASDTFIWLNDEGFVSAQVSSDDPAIYEVRLTLKGLTLLGYQAPERKRGRFKNFAHYAKSVLAEGGMSAATDLMKSMFLRAGTIVKLSLFEC